jgi:hypothetical protein
VTIEFHIRRRGGGLVCDAPTYDCDETDVMVPHEQMCPQCLAGNTPNQFTAAVHSGEVWTLWQQANQPVMLRRYGGGLAR